MQEFNHYSQPKSPRMEPWGPKFLPNLYRKNNRKFKEENKVSAYLSETNRVISVYEHENDVAGTHNNNNNNKKYAPALRTFYKIFPSAEIGTRIYFVYIFGFFCEKKGASRQRELS